MTISDLSRDFRRDTTKLVEADVAVAFGGRAADADQHHIRIGEGIHRGCGGRQTAGRDVLRHQGFEPRFIKRRAALEDVLDLAFVAIGAGTSRCPMSARHAAVTHPT